MVTARITNDGAGSSARYVGRVGALAVALGVGFAVATSPGVAWAEPDATSNNSDAVPGNPDPGPESPATEQAAPSNGAESGAPAAPAAQPADPVGSQSEVTLGGDGPTVVIRSSGGAQSDDDAGDQEVGAQPAGVATGEPVTVHEAVPVPEAVPESDPVPVAATVESSNDAPPQRLTAPPVSSPPPAEPAEEPAPTVLRVEGADALDASAPGGASATGDGADAFALAATPLLAADVPAPVAVPPPNPIAQILAIPATVLNAAATLFTSVVQALFIPAPGAPPDSPLVWAVLAVVRRQFNAAFNNSTPVLNPQQTSQDLDDREVHGTLGAGDVDGDPLTFSVPTSGVGAPANGAVAIDSVNRTWTYTPDAGFSGTDSFTVTASDAGGFHLHGFGQEHTVTKTVSVVVAADDTDQAPVVTPPPPPSDPDEESGAVTGSIGVVDPDGDPLTIVFAEGGAPKYGTVTIDPVTGSYTYTPNQAGRLRAALGLGDTDSFTVVVTQGDPAPAPFARMASFAALAADQGFSETVTIDDIQIAGATLSLAGDPIQVGSRPAGIVVTDRYAYVLNSQDGTVTVIDIADDSVSGDPVTVGTFPALAATDGDRVYVVNALSGTVTVIDTATNTVQGSPITLAPGVSSPGLSPDGSTLFVTNAQLGVVHAVDTATGTVIDSIVVGEPPTPGQEYHVPNGGMAFSEDGTRLYITRQFAELVNGTLTTGSGDVVEIGIDPADPTTYLEVIGSPIALPGKVPAAAQIVGDRMYIGTLNVSEAGQSPDTLTEGTVVVVDVDPDSPTYRQVVDGIRVLPVPMNLAISPDESLAYTVHLGLGMVSVIDLAAGEVLLEIPFDTTPQTMGAPNLIGISPDGSRLYVTNYAENSVVALTIA